MKDPGGLARCPSRSALLLHNQGLREFFFICLRARTSCLQCSLQRECWLGQILKSSSVPSMICLEDPLNS
eukprot:8495743-Karenia_brevis.AAC.1